MENGAKTGRAARGVAVYPSNLSVPKSLSVGNSYVYRVDSAAALLALVDSYEIGAAALFITPETIDRTELVRTIKSRASGIWCVVVGCAGAEQVAVAALRAGADEYISTVDESPARQFSSVSPRRNVRLALMVRQ